MNLVLVILAGSSLALSACGGSTVSPQARSSPSLTGSPSPSASASTATPAATASPSATVPGTAPAAPGASATSLRAATPAATAKAPATVTSKVPAKPAASARTSPVATKSATKTATRSATAHPAASCPASPSPLGMTDNVFTPTTVSVARSARVTVTNCGSNPHTWTSPAAGFDSGRLVKGVSFAVTFPAAGTYAFLCSYHSAMTGSITVR